MERIDTELIPLKFAGIRVGGDSGGVSYHCRRGGACSDT